MGRASRRKAEARATRPPSAIAETVSRLLSYESGIEERAPDIWRAFDQAVQYRRQGRLDWPSWCLLPVGSAVGFCREIGILDGISGDRNAPRVMAGLYGWRKSRSVWRFAPELADAVLSTDIVGRPLPIECFYRLPEWTVYVTFPENVHISPPIKGFFAFLDWDHTNSSPSLRFLFDAPKLGELIHLRLPLTEKTILESLAANETELRSNRELLGLPPKEGRDVEMTAHWVAPMISLVLYICSENADVTNGESGRDRRTRPRSTESVVPVRPHQWDVGFRVSEALRRSAATPGTGDGLGAGVAPHLRRAHWHTYWTGPKRADVEQEAVVKWLHPILVGSGEAEPVVKEVR